MTVQIRRLTGAGPTGTDITSINTRLNAEDVHTTAGTDNPTLVPASGTNYSYKASARLYFNGTGTGTINNIKWFTDGANGLGTGVGLQVLATDTYAQATGTPGETGTEMTGGTNAFLSTTGSPLAVTGTVTDPTNAYFGDIVQLQLTVGTTAGAGATPTETMSWRYDTTISA